MKHVLVVDDTKNIRILLRKCLELEGYTVKTANDGLEALEMLKNEAFDLAFLDIKMSHFSGTEVLKKMRELGINTPVIIITAYATVKNAVECTQMGAVAYIQKPFTADKVRSLLNELSIKACKETDVKSIESFFEQINICLNNGEFKQAVDLLTKAISIEPDNPEVYLLYSRAYKGIGDLIHADKFYSMYKLLKD